MYVDNDNFDMRNSENDKIGNTFIIENNEASNITIKKFYLGKLKSWTEYKMENGKPFLLHSKHKQGGINRVLKFNYFFD